MSERAVVWRRVGRGLLVIGVGVFLLLNTTGRLPWSFWIDLLPLWPVVLVALGLRLIFERSRLPAGVLISPLLVLGTMVWVAYNGGAGVAATGRPVPVRAERPAPVTRWTLEARLAYGDLDVDSRVLDPSALVEGTAASRRRDPEVRTLGAGESARVRVRHRSPARATWWRPTWSRWDLDLAEDLPVSLDMELVYTSGRLDLSRLPLTSVDLNGALNDLELILGQPEREVTMRLEGALSGYEIRVPSGVPVRVVSDGAFNWVSGERGGRQPGYRLRLDGAFNTLTVRDR